VKKRYPRSEALIAQRNSNQQALIIGDSPEMSAASVGLLDHYEGISRGNQSYEDILPNISGRRGLTREGYNYFRPEESTPKKYVDIINGVNDIYKNNGLIKNIIDLMGDFAGQGIRLTHPVKRVEAFYQSWFAKVNGAERTERFLNYLYRTGNVVVTRRTGVLNKKGRDRLYRSLAAEDFAGSPSPNTRKYELPMQYTFVNAAAVTIVGGGLSSFTQRPLYALTLPTKLRMKIISPQTPEEKAIVSQLPEELVNAAKSNKPYVLPPEKTIVHHYKKDDWESWAMPMIYSIIQDVVLLNKLKLADSAALDGAVSNVRIFRIGSMEYKVMPTPYAAAKLAEILQSHTGAGTLDIVWGPDLDMIESKSDIYKFLGEEKYQPVYNAIYAGLGIPPTLTGTMGATGTTNNFISLKTLTERLEYGRERVLAFWKHEIEIVRRAMNFTLPAEIEFDLLDLGDEKSMKTLYKDLADRNIISHETTQHIFKQNPKMESLRLKREAEDRDKGKRVAQAGPFQEAACGESLKKIALQNGTVAPSELGMKLQNRKEGEKTAVELKHENDMQRQQKILEARPKGQPGQGRPKNSTDKTKRKTKTFSPRSGGAIQAWAYRSLGQIGNHILPGLLQTYGKANMRQLTAIQSEEVETIKFGVLCNIEPFSEITQETVFAALQKNGVTNDIKKQYSGYLAEFTIHTSAVPSIEDERHIQACVYTDLFIGE
jgi:hypothetical protein